MLPFHFDCEQSPLLIDTDPKWTSPWTEDLDLGILPRAIEDMDYQTYDSRTSHAARQAFSPEEHSLPSQRFPPRSHSLIDAPTGWSSTIPGPGAHHGASYPQSYGQDFPWPSPNHKAQETVRPKQSSGSSPEFDVSSTISPLSPKTPGARSDIDVNVVPSSASPLISGPSSSATNHFTHFPDPKTENQPPYGGGGISLQQIQPFPDQSYEEPRDSHSSMDFGPEIYPYQLPAGHYGGPHTGGYHPAHVAGSIASSGFEPEMDPEDRRDETMSEADAEGDVDVDYQPQSQTRHPTTTARQTAGGNNPMRPLRARSGGRRQQTFSLTAPNPHTGRVTRTTQQQQPTPSTSNPSSTTSPSTFCHECQSQFPSPATLYKHTLTSHTRPFRCIFYRYACQQTFGSKNEWARHIRVQHLRLEKWRCDIGKCGEDNDDAQQQEGSKHEFDRKDLFIQHVRRMHPGELGITNSSNTSRTTARGTAQHQHQHRNDDDDDNENEGDGTNKLERNRLEISIQQRCHIPIRLPPTKLTCTACSPSPSSSLLPPPPLTSYHGPAPSSSSSSSAFALSASTSTTSPSSTQPRTQAPSTFDTLEPFMEHYAKHLEKSENLGPEDPVMKNWLIGQSLLTCEGNRWKIVGCAGKKGASGGRGRGGGGAGARAAGARASNNNHSGARTAGAGPARASGGAVQARGRQGTRSSARYRATRVRTEQEEDAEYDSDIE